MGVDKIEGLKDRGVRSMLGRDEENLAREDLLTDMRSRVALMLAKQISQLQLASFLQPG